MAPGVEASEQCRPGYRAHDAMIGNTTTARSHERPTLDQFIDSQFIVSVSLVDVSSYLIPGGKGFDSVLALLSVGHGRDSGHPRQASTHCRLGWAPIVQRASFSHRKTTRVPIRVVDGRLRGHEGGSGACQQSKPLTVGMKHIAHFFYVSAFVTELAKSAAASIRPRATACALGFRCSVSRAADTFGSKFNLPFGSAAVGCDSRTQMPTASASVVATKCAPTAIRQSSAFSGLSLSIQKPATYLVLGSIRRLRRRMRYRT